MLLQDGLRLVLELGYTTLLDAGKCCLEGIVSPCCFYLSPPPPWKSNNNLSALGMAACLAIVAGKIIETSSVVIELWDLTYTQGLRRVMSTTPTTKIAAVPQLHSFTYLAAYLPSHLLLCSPSIQARCSQMIWGQRAWAFSSLPVGLLDLLTRLLPRLL